MIQSIPKLSWSNDLSVGVQLLDDQHKAVVAVINELIECVSTTPSPEKIEEVIARLTNYKQKHFTTEEKYFAEFDYDGAVEHIAAHRGFNDSLVSMQKEYTDNTIGFAFSLLDFLEDWLINHIETMDRKYIQCFHDHGLR